MVVEKIKEKKSLVHNG